MKTLTVLCNAGLLNITNGTLRTLKPIVISKPVWNGSSDSKIGECLFIAEFDADELEQFTDEECETASAWWRKIGRSSVDWESHPWRPKIARQCGVFHWICEEFDLSQPRNIAAILGDIAAIENKTPIELFNSFPFV